MHHLPDVTPSHQVGGYHEFAPPPDLRDAVEALWIHQAACANVVPHRVVPDAAVSLCFTGGRAPDGSAGDARLRIIGPVIRPRTFAPPAGHRMESVRIKLEWCRVLLGVAPWEHTDAEALYADVRPDLAAPLESGLARTRTSIDALRVLVSFLRARREARSSAGALLTVGMESLRHYSAQPRVAELAARLGVSDRHLRRLMMDETGFSPRRFARIQRFHALLRSADAAERPAWAALAFHHGYADQPHLIREVQDLAGVTPARLHSERRAE
ncbi:MAG TPA: AraC family transcriptional regulator [Gemmatimonadaceae bacterium]|jgi:AraC-like DNA-binding protein|nr:AraC family transcriptional regulator [Gemmatimonadaceae bacterium]